MGGGGGGTYCVLRGGDPPLGYSVGLWGHGEVSSKSPDQTGEFAAKAGTGDLEEGRRTGSGRERVTGVRLQRPGWKEPGASRLEWGVSGELPISSWENGTVFPFEWH